jgi:hypothetical protein
MDIEELHKRCEELGIDTVKEELLSRRFKHIGGSPENRAEAEKWVREKEAKSKEIIGSSVNIHGLNFNWRELWNRIQAFYPRLVECIKSMFCK